MGGSNPSDLMPALSDWQVKEDSKRLLDDGNEGVHLPQPQRKLS
jgi:hypothetical protein